MRSSSKDDVYLRNTCASSTSMLEVVQVQLGRNLSKITLTLNQSSEDKFIRQFSMLTIKFPLIILTFI